MTTAHAETETASPAPTIACPLCTAPGQTLFETRGFPIARCTRCDHWYAARAVSADHVSEVYGDDYFTAGGAGYADYLAEGTLLRRRGAEYARRVARHRSPGRMLDVGAAAGFLARGWADEGWQAQGIEPNARMAEYGRDHLGVDIHNGTLESFQGAEPFDLVSFVQVLPHFIDPAAALAAASRLTAPEGFWLIETWNRRSWTARLAGRGWHEFSPPSVLHWFTPRGVAQLAGRFGFVEVARGRPRRMIQLGHAKSLLAHSAGNSLSTRALLALLRLVPDGLAVPYPGDDLFWMLLSRGARR